MLAERFVAEAADQQQTLPHLVATAGEPDFARRAFLMKRAGRTEGVAKCPR
jgi:hypothetical protein